MPTRSAPALNAFSPAPVTTPTQMSPLEAISPRRAGRAAHPAAQQAAGLRGAAGAEAVRMVRARRGRQGDERSAALRLQVKTLAARPVPRRAQVDVQRGLPRVDVDVINLHRGWH